MTSVSNIKFVGRILTCVLIITFLSFETISKPKFTVGSKVHDKEKIINAVNFYSQHLGFDTTVYIMVKYSMDLHQDIDAVVRYRSIGNDAHQILITINSKNSHLNRLLALAHEMIHAKQYIDGRLVSVDARTFRWEQNELIDINNIEYIDRPWEFEALNFSKKMRRKYLQHVRNQKKILKTFQRS